MGLFSKRGRPSPSKKITRISRDVLESIADAAQETHPLEFAGALKAQGNRISGVALIPGTISGNEHAILQLYNLPTDFSIVGSVHSHPSPSACPSEADRQLFKNFGRVHIIMAYPYTVDTWKAYDSYGYEMWLELV